VHVRPARPDDAGALRRFHAGLSRESVYLRYFSAKPKLSTRFVERFTHTHESSHLVLFAFENDAIVAMASYDRLGERDVAAVAFCVADAQQGRGLATALFEQLVEIGRENGFRRFVADTLAENRAMRLVLESSGFDLERARKHDVVHFEFPIDPTERWVARVEAREHRSESISVARLLQPRTVAVVAHEPGGPGALALRSLLRCGYNGRVYTVGRGGAGASGTSACASVHAIPDDVDLALIDAPAAALPELVVACGERRAHGVVLLGHADAARPTDADLRDLVERARAGGMRLLGPGSLGILNTEPEHALAAAAVERIPGRGPVGLVCQSIETGRAALSALCNAGLGISGFVSLGQRADVSSNDLLQYFEADPATSVVLVCVESFGNPRKFARIARRLGLRKPIRSFEPRGAGPLRPAVGAIGVIVDEELPSAVETARLLAHQPLPRGRRVGVLGIEGSGVRAAAACGAAGLTLAEPSRATRRALHPALPANGPARSACELAPGTSRERWGAVLRALLSDRELDMLLVVVPDPESEGPRALAGLSTPTRLPVAAALVGAARPGVLACGPAIPLLESPEAAARLLDRVVRYTDWRQRPTQPPRPRRNDLVRRLP
jgi:acyl-CoA synthetase (NDP forming)/RimJ/RimL family protein N-acetyltransferase